MSYTNNEIKDSIVRVINYIKKNKKRPQTIKVGKDTVQLAKYLNSSLMVDARNRIRKFREQKKIYPNYVEIKGIKVDKDIYKVLWNIQTKVDHNLEDVNSVQNQNNSTTRFVSSPYLLSSSWVKQDYDTSCALNSLQESFYKLTRKTVSESTMYKLGYTGSGGTGHEGIKGIVNWFNKNYKTNISVEFKNLKDFGKTSKEQWTNIGKLMSQSNVAVFFHIYYRNGGSSCTPTITNQDHGHYEICDIINVGTGYVRALNSLSGGYLQDRKISVQECFMKKISQPSVIILTKK